MSDGVPPIVQLIVLCDHVDNLDGVIPSERERPLREQAEKGKEAYYKVVEEIAGLEGRLERLTSAVRYGLKSGFDRTVIEVLRSMVDP